MPESGAILPTANFPGSSPPVKGNKFSAMRKWTIHEAMSVLYVMEVV
jgi:hypothetical protein